MQLNPYQQQMVAQKINDELKKVTLSWNNNLKAWYPFAMEALKHASVMELRIPQDKYPELFEQTPHGLNMNTVGTLSNNLEARTPVQMNMTPLEWREILKMNSEVAKDWEALCSPIRQKIIKEFEIMNGKEAGLKLIKAQA